MIIKLSEDNSFLDVEGIPISIEISTLEELDLYIRSLKAPATLLARDYGYEVCHPYDF